LKLSIVSFQFILQLYKAIAVRERTLEAITDIACQDVKLISDEIWRYVFQHIYEKKERPRQCAITCLSTVWISLDDKHKRVKDKILEQLRKGYQYANVGQLVKRDASFRWSLSLYLPYADHLDDAPQFSSREIARL